MWIAALGTALQMLAKLHITVGADKEVPLIGSDSQKYVDKESTQDAQTNGLYYPLSRIQNVFFDAWFIALLILGDLLMLLSSAQVLRLDKSALHP